MGAIHELLAALNEAENQDKTIFAETVNINQRKEVFEGYDKVLCMYSDDRKNEEAGAAEQQALATTVRERLFYQKDFQVRNLDCQAQREKANSKATADVKLPDGKELKGLPVTLLMYLEKYLQNYRALLQAIPTHDTKIEWVKDKDAAMKGAWRTKSPIKSNRTEKTQVPIILSEATKEHKAQVQLITEERTIGRYEKVIRTGRWSPAQKHTTLTRLDELIAEIKKAKARANQTPVDDIKIGDVLMNSILSGIDIT